MDNGKTVAIVGSGYWGKKVIAEYTKLLDAKVLTKIYVFDITKNLLNFSDKRIIPETNLEKFVEDINFAHVCTPNNTHFDVVKKLLENGIATLVEKPISEKPEEAEELLKIAIKNSVKLKVGMVYRFSSAVEGAMRLIGDSVGSPKLISASWLHNIEVPNIVRVMKERDVVWDIFIHLLDVINYLYDSWPEFYYSVGETNSYNLNHSFFATGSIERSKLNMRSSFISHMKERKIELIGENGNLILDLLNNTVTVGSDDDQRKISFNDNPLYSEILSFINSDEKDDHRNDGNVGISETRILAMLLEKSKNRRFMKR